LLLWNFEKILHNNDEIILNVNHAFVRMTDSEVAELVDKKNFELAIPESQELIRKNLSKL